MGIHAEKRGGDDVVGQRLAMRAPENPYQPPSAVIEAGSPRPAQPVGRRPYSLWVVLACYVIYNLLEAVSWLAVLPRDDDLTGVVGSAFYSLGIAICLWRGVNWVRWWVVLTTLLTLLLLMFMVTRGIADNNRVVVIACLLRITVAFLLFLPSVRRWFVPRGA
ncbi:hypothetical protein [Pseudoxanthomonas sp. Root65]|uniref:hypothetical protein n=1 Tax=Pseudoxanthomonas sp. Root65 TaxID=1736576 RepID=UPI001F26BB8C|nr:hypothetical protein [Pseudoxanthomonas sp. Root65]